jgi:hypothetical protein
MISEFRSRPFFPGAALAALAAGLALHAGPVRAEDPLLGSIKAIQCVGCDPGAVNLVVHDPIDVRDFEVQIKESDYQKIVTPLAGKTVYDKNGCFYWMELPKPAKDAAKDGAKDRDKKAAKKPVKKEAAAGSDSAQPGTGGIVETSAPPRTPEVQGTPSKCIPYVRVEPKPAPKKGGKKNEE